MRNEELFKERPVWNAILTLAIPSVLSILVMLLYNMADMFFVGLLHDNVQVAAVSVVGPIFSLVTAAATMVGIGGCAAIAKAAGAGEVDHKLCTVEYSGRSWGNCLHLHPESTKYSTASVNSRLLHVQLCIPV